MVCRRVRSWVVVLPVMVVFALSSNLTYAAVGALLRQWLAQGQRLLWFNRAMALVLVVTAADERFAAEASEPAVMVIEVSVPHWSAMVAP